MKRNILILPFFLVFVLARSQSVLAPLNKEYSHLVDRAEILSGSVSPDVHTSFKPFAREGIYDLTTRVREDTTLKLSRRDTFNLGYLQDDNWEWADSASMEGNSRKPLLKYFYRKKNAIYHFRSEDFEIQVNPVFHILGGRENTSESNRVKDPNFINTRGAEARGMIDKRIGFYAIITTTQALFPSYVRERTFTPGLMAVPGEGYFKGYRINGVDFFTARGYLTFRFTKHIHFQFGHDRNFIGNGYRSLILSDYSSPYLFGKIQTRIWKLQYTNLYAQMFYNTNIGRDTTYSRKFMTLHHLSINIGKHLNLGLFESIIYTRSNNQFDLNYLNPLIFYRYAETYMGSSDKATLGIDMKLNVARSISFYGQVVLNEFKIKEITNGNGWWGNKQAFQLGLKYLNVAGLKNVDLQLEANAVRPYTYTSLYGNTNYSHYNQPLAHPMGANFVEGIAILRVQPHKRVFVTAKGILTRIGLNDSINYGSNIFIPYERVIADRPYGNKYMQGVTTNIINAEVNLSYMVRHNLFFDMTFLMREQKPDNGHAAYKRSTTFASAGIRYNFSRRDHDF